MSCLFDIKPTGDDRTMKKGTYQALRKVMRRSWYENKEEIDREAERAIRQFIMYGRCEIRTPKYKVK